MICAKCGFENNDGAKTCAKCGSFLEPGAEEKKKHRKVVQLPSNQPAGQTAPVDLAAKTSAATGAADAAASGAKSPTPRRRSGATGKIPALKHPVHEDGKIPAEERKSASAARRSEDDEPSYSPAPRTRSKQVIIDDAVLAAEAASSQRAKRSAQRTSVSASTRRSDAQRSDTQRPAKKGTNRTKTLILAIAILILICLIALGMFLVNTGSNERTVSFDTNGGTVIGNQYFAPEEKLARPANPSRPGYEFEGWYLDADFSEEATFPLDITQNMTLYAKWKQESSTPSGSVDNSGVPSSTTETPQGAGATTSNGSTGNGSANASGNSSANAGGGSASANRPNSGSNAGSTTPSKPSKPSLAPNDNTASNGKVNVSVMAANGSVLSGTVTLHDGYVIPNSSEKAYTVAELKALGLNDAEICIARNEPYARMGYSFRNPQLQAYFNARSWYHNTGWRGQLAEGSAGYITAHNLLTLSKETAGAAAWNSLSTR